MNKILGYIILATLTSSCTINSDIMFKTPTEYEYDTFIAKSEAEYTISPNDILNFRLFTNNGIQLLELNRNQPNASRNLSFSLNYLVRPDSLVDLPTLGLVNITGLTVPEAQDSLSAMYEVFYNDPFVQVEVTNNRVIVFPGSGGAAKTVALTNNNTSVIEVLAMTGGISSRGKAQKIKLIRIFPMSKFCQKIILKVSKSQTVFSFSSHLQEMQKISVPSTFSHYTLRCSSFSKLPMMI